MEQFTQSISDANNLIFQEWLGCHEKNEDGLLHGLLSFLLPHLFFIAGWRTVLGWCTDWCYNLRLWFFLCAV